MTRRDLHRGASELIVFGRHPVREAIRSPGVEVLEVKLAKERSTADRRAFREAARRADISVEEVSRGELSRWTGASRHDQGVAARVRLLRVGEVESFVAARKGRAARVPSRLIALDGVTNSQNVGMVVRSVVGAGLDGLLWPLVGQPWVNGLVVRAAAGALFECPIVTCDSLASGLGALQAAGYVCCGLEAGAGRSVFECDVPHRSVFVLGSETTGLSEDVRSLLDDRVSIPMAGPLESLNVAVAAGLVCFRAAGLLGPPEDAIRPIREPDAR
ncbi:MAG TPA: RNA methyltransferase [Deltaproteobacteria bacterium]|nr:RNA methyltransferase [Deltaproteobacteria bacterium]